MGDEAAEYSWKLAQVRLLRIPIIALALLAIIFQSLIPIVPSRGDWHRDDHCHSGELHQNEYCCVTNFRSPGSED